MAASSPTSPSRATPKTSGNERIDLCRNACDAQAVPGNSIGANLITSAQNPAGNLFNESISSELAGTLAKRHRDQRL